MFENIINEVKAEILDDITTEIYAGSVRQSATLIYLAIRNDPRPVDQGRQDDTEVMERAVQLAVALDAKLERELQG